MIANSDGQFIQIPALTTSSIDRVGAGDSYLALSALCFAKNFSSELCGFIGAAAAALDIQIVGNKSAVDKINLCKFINTLMK